MKTRSFIWGLFIVLIGTLAISLALTRMVESVWNWKDIVVIPIALYIIIRGSIRIFQTIN